MDTGPIEPKKEFGAVANLDRTRYRAAVDRLNRATDAEIWRCDHNWVTEYGPHASTGWVVCVRCGAFARSWSAA